MTELHYITKNGVSAYCRPNASHPTVELLINRMRPFVAYMEVREFELSASPEKPRVFIPV